MNIDFQMHKFRYSNININVLIQIYKYQTMLSLGYIIFNLSKVLVFQIQIFKL